MVISLPVPAVIKKEREKTGEIRLPVLTVKLFLLKYIHAFALILQSPVR